ncbi:hypothetical protein [Ferrimonas gelatinilytica]|uniref:Pyrrolidone-carboxylate peptidase n=1 Tax=Ferrimonas gelatinilytica TaxID=1255257 RepID=A0ABP9SFB9_9GAMM
MNKLGWGLAMSLVSGAIMAAPLDTEELRLERAQETMGPLTQRYEAQVDQLIQRYRADDGELTATRKVAEDASALWRAAVEDVQGGFFDDRALYWNRLAARTRLKQSDPGFAIVPWQREIMLSTLEKASRGMSDIHFDDDSDIKILLTGFDPFRLDDHIDQSNPSGLAALALDGQRWQVDGRKVQVETVLIPVRFADFDQGLIESLLTPYLRDRRVDMVVTVSMGRDGFDLERFPGRNRSAEAGDNLNVVTGASKTQPLPPTLNGTDLNGPEFLEFSLPVAQLQKATGRYEIRDNRQVTTRQGDREARSLLSLRDATSVAGSGGGYLSNEISYRSLLLKQLLESPVPVGHIHTPKIQGYDEQQNRAIVEQLEAMLKHAVTAL